MSKRLILVLVVVGGAGLLLIWHWRSNHQRARFHNIADTRMDLAIIAGSLQDLSRVSPSTVSRTSFNKADAHALYAIMRRSAIPVIEARHAWDSRGALVDRWGHEFRIEAILLNEKTNGPKPEFKVQFRIWSIGPNGKDEGGIGDDITNETFTVGFQE